MVTMNILRMLADVSFYGALAGFVAVKCGGGGAFAGAVLQCIFFGLSALGRERRPLRLLLLLPMLLGFWLYRGSLPDCLLLAPTAVYILWLAWRGDYALSRERQQQLFGAFWKVLLIFALAAALMGSADEVAAVTLPYALAALVASVLLMRALRHDPRVYCQKKYQLINASAVALVVAAAYLISRRRVLDAAAALLKGMYDHLLRPVLEVVLGLLLLLIWGISRLISLLPALVRGEPVPEEPPELDLSGVESILGEEVQVREPGWLLRALGILLLTAVVAAVLVLFFRWLSRRGGGEGPQDPAQEQRGPVFAARQGPRRGESTPVRSIRAQYRRFLKLCADLGAPPERGSTSLDVHRRASVFPGPARVSAQIRELYIRARYAGRADQEDVQNMKKLCAEAKKSAE